MSERPTRYREFLAICKRYGVRELPGRGKGSEMLWERTCRCPECHGRRRTATVTHHPKDLGRGLIRAVRQRLHLDAAHGVTDREFYA